jgi:hypothetical protein
VQNWLIKCSSAFYGHSKNRLVALHSALLGSRRDELQSAQCNLSTLLSRQRWWRCWGSTADQVVCVWERERERERVCVSGYYWAHTVFLRIHPQRKMNDTEEGAKSNLWLRLLRNETKSQQTNSHKQSECWKCQVGGPLEGRPYDLSRHMMQSQKLQAMQGAALDKLFLCALSAPTCRGPSALLAALSIVSRCFNSRPMTCCHRYLPPPLSDRHVKKAETDYQATIKYL